MSLWTRRQKHGRAFIRPDILFTIAEEASKSGLPVILDAERKREGLDALLTYADYLVTSAKFSLRPGVKLKSEFESEIKNPAAETRGTETSNVEKPPSSTALSSVSDKDSV
ncbi:hypothetical protein R1flu_005644 [Riccia fluitans]|uniref:Uncharacterized protein n=1 Tax=Riccia fluitans TaxID=41844 RepID=A0ABD1YUK4_9MARC